MNTLDTVPRATPAFHAGNGTLCLIGDYDPEKGFTRRSAQAIDYGLDFYAPQTLEAPDGRLIQNPVRGLEAYRGRR